MENKFLYVGPYLIKDSFQVRIGGMDGIFLAYHNTSRIFGFQYVPLCVFRVGTNRQCSSMLTSK